MGIKRSRADGLLSAQTDLSGGVILSGSALVVSHALYATETLAEEMRDILSAGARRFRWRRRRTESASINGEASLGPSTLHHFLKIDDLAVEVDRSGAWLMATFATREPIGLFLKRTPAMGLLDSLDQCFSDSLNDKWAAGIGR